MKSMRTHVIFILLGLILGTVMSEIGARFIFPAPYSYDDVLHERLTDGPRLSMPGDYGFMASGLYEDVPQLIHLRVSQDRFIEPVQTGGQYHILFLGGSTTEALYVQESHRWVAQLNEPGLIATYNAGQSGGNTLDAYYTFKYLVTRGDRFDLVVLMTAVNDFTWMRRLRHYHSNMNIDDYLNGFEMWYTDHKASQDSNWKTYLTQNSRLIYAALRAKQVMTANTTLADALREPVEIVKQLPLVNQDECEGYDQEIQAYRENAEENLALLMKEVTASGAKFLVLSEATSYGAPTDSFFRDLRYPVSCSDETARISFADSEKLMSHLNHIYLNAALSAGANTFDLASQAGELTNGAQGGQYMYDSIHYTERGSTLVATLLKPVLYQLLGIEPN